MSELQTRSTDINMEDLWWIPSSEWWTSISDKYPIPWTAAYDKFVANLEKEFNKFNAMNNWDFYASISWENWWLLDEAVDTLQNNPAQFQEAIAYLEELTWETGQVKVIGDIMSKLKDLFLRLENKANDFLDKAWVPGWRNNQPGFSPVIQWLDGENYSGLDDDGKMYMGDKKNETVTQKKWEKEILLDYADLRKAVLVLRAVNHQLRQRIIDLLEESENITVTNIYIKLRLEQSVASQHLAILRRAGVVKTERNGKFIYYSLDKNRLKQISKLVSDLTS